MISIIVELLHSNAILLLFLVLAIGYLEREVEQTDLSTFLWAIVFGIFLGALSFKVSGVEIGLGSAGELLVLGLFIGYLRSIFPVFGRVPEAARWVFTEMGLLLFMAGVGLRGGAGLVEKLLSSGLPLVLAGIAVTLVSLTIAHIFGRRVQKMNPYVAWFNNRSHVLTGRMHGKQ